MIAERIGSAHLARTHGGDVADLPCVRLIDTVEPRQIDDLAEKYKWDDQKKQQILDILTQQGQKINELREASRGEDATRESREQVQEQMRQVRDETQKALEGLLTQEELQDMQRATRPVRRERGVGRRNRFPSGRQPGGNGK